MVEWLCCYTPPLRCLLAGNKGFSSSMTISNKQAVSGILALSAVIVAFLFWLIYFAPSVGNKANVAFLPAANALLNSTSAVCVALGILAIKGGKRDAHMRFMISATIASGLFLVCYIVYHSVQGDTKFLGQGFIRPVYFFILISHILLSIAVVPMILCTLFFAISKRFVAHKRIAKFTYPVWLYVSVTGVLVFLLLRFYPVAS